LIAGTAKRASCLLIVITASAACGVGCGAASPDASRIAAFVAAANNMCGEQQDNREVPTFKAHVRMRLEKVAHEDRDLPSLRQLFADVAARSKLRERARKSLDQRLRRAAEGRSPGSPNATESESYSLALRVYRDEKALGMTVCAREPPRKPIGE
jgi:hypothetical protein